MWPCPRALWGILPFYALCCSKGYRPGGGAEAPLCAHPGTGQTSSRAVSDFLLPASSLCQAGQGWGPQVAPPSLTAMGLTLSQAIGQSWAAEGRGRNGSGQVPVPSQESRKAERAHLISWQTSEVRAADRPVTFLPLPSGVGPPCQARPCWAGQTWGPLFTQGLSAPGQEPLAEESLSPEALSLHGGVLLCVPAGSLALALLEPEQRRY